MTVRELVKLLQDLPPDVQDFPVIYYRHSDYSRLEPFQIEVQRATDSLKHGTAILHHNLPGEFRSYSGTYEYKGSPLPEPANVVIFPGN